MDRFLDLFARRSEATRWVFAAATFGAPRFVFFVRFDLAWGLRDEAVARAKASVEKEFLGASDNKAREMIEGLLQILRSKPAPDDDES